MKYILTFFTFLFCSGLFAQETARRDTILDIPVVVVRSTPIRDTLKNIPAAVNILDRIQLSQNDKTIITPILNQIPGVYMQQGALNTNRITIRGIGARSQYATDRVKAYLDGIPISFAEGSTVIEDIDMNVLESVEVIKGPVSSIYGAGLGGVINLYTLDPDENRIRIGTTSGSFGLMKSEINGSFKLKNTSFLIGYNHLQSDGFRENSNYDRQSFTFKANHRFNEKNEISFLTNLTRLQAFIPSSINETNLRENPEMADGNWGRAEGFESYDRMVTGLSYTHRFTPRLRNTTSIFTQIWDAYEPRPFDILDEETWNAGARTVFNYDFAVFGRSAELAFGSEYIREYYEGATIENRYKDFPGQGSVAGAKITQQEQVRENINVFAQQRLRLSTKLALEAGVNFNSTWYDLTTILAPDDLDQSGNYRFDPILSPRLGLTYRLSPEKSLYATASHGFSVPGVAETLTPEGLINTDLKPETGINYELGLKADWLDRKLYTEVAVYSIQVSNLLVAQRVGDDQYVGINAGRTAHNGIEMLIRYNAVLPSGWIIRPYGSAAFQFYTFQDFVDDEEDFSGNDLTGVPDRTVNLGLEIFSPKGFRLSVNHLHVGLIPLNDANTAYADAYNLLNMKVAYELNFFRSFDIQLHAGINNILDANYASSILPNAVGFGGNAPRYFYPGNARNFYGGLSVGFGF